LLGRKGKKRKNEKKEKREKRNEMKQPLVNIGWFGPDGLIIVVLLLSSFPFLLFRIPSSSSSAWLWEDVLVPLFLNGFSFYFFRFPLFFSIFFFFSKQRLASNDCCCCWFFWNFVCFFFFWSFVWNTHKHFVSLLAGIIIHISHFLSKRAPKVSAASNSHLILHCIALHQQNHSIVKQLVFFFSSFQFLRREEQMVISSNQSSLPWWVIRYCW